jgi:DNA-binding SARP family transcriptional activator
VLKDPFRSAQDRGTFARSVMEFRILGPLEVVDEGRSLPLGGARQRALLTALLLRANQVVSTDQLLDEVWSDEPPASGVRVVQVYVSQLRKVLGDGVIQTRAPGYVLVAEPDSLDLQRFEGLVREARKAEPAAAAANLRDALALWRGPPLTDVAYHSFAQTEIGRLEELRLSALEARIEADLRLGRHAEVVGELEALVAEHPLREGLRAHLMLALYRSGRQAEALEAYQEARRALVEELGIEPDRSLRDLEKTILRQDPVLDFVSATEATRGTFVGREAELKELLAGLEDAVSGRGRLCLLVGEPGIGKSRLADELIRRARTRGARVLVGRCWEAGGAPAYWPWVQSLRVYVHETEPETLRAQLGSGAAEVAQILPELRELLPGLPDPPSVESEAARFHLFDAATQFLRSASASRPIVLVLDDLHAADAPSLLLLQFLARELGPMRMLVVGAYRDVDPVPGGPLTELLAELAREPVTRRLPLAGLSEQDVAEYVERTASDLVSDELIEALHAETEGNPLFVGETVRLLALEGFRSEGQGIAIPQSIRDVIARRLAHLSEDCNRVLTVASVLGREFALDLLAPMAGTSEDDLIATLDEALAARVVSDVPGASSRLRFAHVLIRDTLYEGLSTARRVRLHRLSAEVLESLYGDQAGPHLAELAHHAIAGSDFDKGLAYARRAGDRALALLAFEEAVRLYATALEALDLSSPSDERMRCELLLALGEAEIRAGNTPVAKQTFLAAAETARGLGLSFELARAAEGYGGRIVWVRAGGDTRLVPLLEEGLAALGDEDVELRVRLLARLAGALRDEHSRERRDRLSAEAVQLARRTENLAALAYALSGRGHAFLGPDTMAETLAIGTELCEVAASCGDGERAQAGHMLRIMAQLTIGEVQRVEADLAAVSRISDELRQPAQLWEACVVRGMLALAEGRLAEAGTLIPQALSLGERAVPEGAIPHYRVQWYTLCDFRGHPEEAEQEIRDLAAEYPARPVFRCLVAHLEARLGRTAEARRTLAGLSADDVAALPFDQEWLLGMSLLAETAALLSDAESAAVLYRLLVPWAAFNAVDQSEANRGSVSRYLGLLATTMAQWTDAERHFEDATAMNARMGARPWLAHAEHDYAHMLLARAEPRDRERAGELLESAIATYRELGMAPAR